MSSDFLKNLAPLEKLAFDQINFSQWWYGPKGCGKTTLASGLHWPGDEPSAVVFFSTERSADFIPARQLDCLQEGNKQETIWTKFKQHVKTCREWVLQNPEKARRVFWVIDTLDWLILGAQKTVAIEIGKNEAGDSLSFSKIDARRAYPRLGDIMAPVFSDFRALGNTVFLSHMVKKGEGVKEWVGPNADQRTYNLVSFDCALLGQIGYHIGEATDAKGKVTLTKQRFITFMSPRADEGSIRIGLNLEPAYLLPGPPPGQRFVYNSASGRPSPNPAEPFLTDLWAAMEIT